MHRAHPFADSFRFICGFGVPSVLEAACDRKPSCPPDRKVVAAPSPASMVEMSDPSDEEHYEPFEKRTNVAAPYLFQQDDAVPDSDIMNSHGEFGPQRKSSSSARAYEKATNCHATVLSIGTWELHSTYEGDLLAKFYYATNKLIWGILEDGIKSKIEIQWSDIAALKATFPKDGPDTLELLLLRVPKFFREINPQPKKHTVWQVCSDFTGGHASVYRGGQLIKIKTCIRRHFLRCKSGLLAKHFEKLVQSDSHLKLLSQWSDILPENLSYEPTFLNFYEHRELNCNVFDYAKNAYGYPDKEFLESLLSCATAPVRIDFGQTLLVSVDAHSHGQDTGSEENFVNEAKRFTSNQDWEEITTPQSSQSISVESFLLESEHQGSEEMNICNLSVLDAAQTGQDMILQEVAQQLLSDSHMTKIDERSLMFEVNSFCSLIHGEDAMASAHHNGNGDIAVDNGRI